MLKKILIVIVLVVAILAVVVAMQPSEFSVSRSTVVNAPPAVVFAQVNDYRKWQGWSPWAKLDPEMNVTYGGPETGEGATYSWTGNEEVGEGKMTITKSDPPKQVQMKLEFIKPFAATNDVEFALEPNEGKTDQTQVTWTMSGKHTFMSKAFCMFRNMQDAIGKDFDKGLEALKAQAESAK